MDGTRPEMSRKKEPRTKNDEAKAEMETHFPWQHLWKMGINDEKMVERRCYVTVCYDSSRLAAAFFVAVRDSKERIPKIVGM